MASAAAKHELENAPNGAMQPQSFRRSSTISNSSEGRYYADVRKCSKSWQRCQFCVQQLFKSVEDFVQHLRERHCTREGGSYVCRYGYNGVCASLPLDGVSDRDYESHVAKYHVNAMAQECPAAWSLFSAAQNLPAALNDPSRGKQTNLFTKKWGDHFVEKSHIPASEYLPDITLSDFARYLNRIGKRYRRHQRMSLQPTPVALAEREQLRSASNTTAAMSMPSEGSLTDIPEIFLKSELQLNQPDNFTQVFPGIGKCDEASKQTGRLLQEKLSHYLDIVEVKIARQVSQKSSAFFHAMTSQDAIMEEMQQATRNVQQLRESLKQLHSSAVADSFRILRYALRRQNYEEVLDKLCLMATVHKTQPMLQLLLGTQDYVAALDLIGTTQEILLQELVGVHCFKHLPMQLTEMEKLIDKMLTTEFERYATADLNRPLSELPSETESVTAEEDKLVCIVMGLLRKKNFSFIDAYKDEAIATIRTIIKQLVIEVISASDAELCLTGAGEEAQSLSIAEWIALLRKATVALHAVLLRIKSVTGIMLQAADAAAGHCANAAEGQTVNLIDAEAFLTSNDRATVREKLEELLQAVCNYCHERCANLVSTQSLERAIATAQEIEQLTQIVEEFCAASAQICGARCVPLQVAAKVQASRFANRFHSERKQKLALLLDSERWRQVEIPYEFQKIIEHISEHSFTTPYAKSTSLAFNGSVILNGHAQPLSSSSSLDSSNSGSSSHTTQANPVLLVEGKPYTLIGAVLILVQILSEYCYCAQRLPIVAGYLSRNVVDLLRTFNSRSCQLIIGAGAMRVAGLKTITSTNLALVSRALQLVLWLLPKIKAHFQALDASSVTGYDSITKDYHSHIKEIEHKIYGIVTERVAAQLEQWDARPPIPSQAFRNISRHLVKLHEAIAPILPEQQIHAIYDVVHRNFKDKLREQLLKHNVNNNGGPQHGVVTSELTFYMETLRTLRALPAEELSDKLTETIWAF